MSSLGPLHNLGPVPHPAPHTVPAHLIQPPSASASLLDKSSAFVREHKKAVLISASVALFGSAAYYYYYLAPSSRKKAGSDVEKGEVDEEGVSAKSGGKKKKSKKGKKKSVNDFDGPLFEEIVPPKETTKVEEEKKEDGTFFSQTGFPLLPLENASVGFLSFVWILILDIVEQSDDISSMTPKVCIPVTSHLHSAILSGSLNPLLFLSLICAMNSKGTKHPRRSSQDSRKHYVRQKGLPCCHRLLHSRYRHHP